ncbi:MAG: DUF3786 domain-containing protein [Spirochaetales bacterium]|nr:DUF3786 domain-containing protein [Spirochaetales bacterium]
MCHKIDPVFFNKLKERDLAEICDNSLAVYDKTEGTYTVRCFYEDYAVIPGKSEIRKKDMPIRKPDVELSLLILQYLLNAKNIQPAKNWVSVTGLTGGAVFFTSTHAIRNGELANCFGTDLEGFKKACSGAGGKPVAMGDVAFELQVLPRVPVVVVFWYTEEELGASAKLLVDATIERHIPLDVIFEMSLELYGKITGKPFAH